MNIVMPMAGRGSRFAAIGIDTPKPLIDVRGKPMYAWAMDSLPLDMARRVVFICLEEHLGARAGLEADINRRYGFLEPVIVPLREVTDGQACTVLMARDLIDSPEPLCIYNADTFSRTAIGPVAQALGTSVAGVIDVFRAPGDKWSFARLDESGRVLETAEKRRISDWATTGLYYFARGREFVRHADDMVRENSRVNGEFYVAPVYNRLIAAGADVRANDVEEVWVLGTPEDLERFLSEYPT